MQVSHFGRAATISVFASLLVLCIATNAYLAYGITNPPRTFHVRIVIDPKDPAGQRVPLDSLRARLESVAGFFQQSAGIRLAFSGFTNVEIPHENVQPDGLRRYLEVRTPRDNADVLVAFWSPAKADPRLGSAPPFSPVAIVRLDSGSPERDRAVLVHQLLGLFGVPSSTDPKSVMHSDPTVVNLDSKSRSTLMRTRLFDFSRGLGGMNRHMQIRVLETIAGWPETHGDPPQLVLANLLMRDGQYRTALAPLRSVVAANPSNLAARVALAHSLALTSQFADAKLQAQAALKLAPDSDQALYELGYVLARSGEPELAIEQFRRAIVLAPNSARNHAGLAVAYVASIGEFENATREFELATKLDPNDAMLLADIEYVRRLRTRIDRDAATAAGDVQRSPDNVQARLRLAALLLRQGKATEAREQIDRSLKLAPSSWQPHYLLSVAFYLKRDYATAQSELETAKKLGSGSRPHLEQSMRAALENTSPAGVEPPLR